MIQKVDGVEGEIDPRVLLVDIDFYSLLFFQ